MPTSTDLSLTPLPTADELAWVDHLVSDATGKALEIVEHLEQAFKFDKVEGNTFVSRRDFELMTLEQLGSQLLLAHGLALFGNALRDYAERLETVAHSLYTSHEDTSKGVVAGVAGVESYLAYRERIAAGYTVAAEDADAVVATLRGSKGVTDDAGTL